MNDNPVSKTSNLCVAKLTNSRAIACPVFIDWGALILIALNHNLIRPELIRGSLNTKLLLLVIDIYMPNDIVCEHYRGFIGRSELVAFKPMHNLPSESLLTRNRVKLKCVINRLYLFSRRNETMVALTSAIAHNQF